jgi:hypothetical protein
MHSDNRFQGWPRGIFRLAVLLGVLAHQHTHHLVGIGIENRDIGAVTGTLGVSTLR